MVKVLGAIFEKKNYTIVYVCGRLNGYSKLVFDADQHPEVHLSGNE